MFRGLFDIKKHANCLMLKKCWREGGTAVSWFEGLPVWAFQVEWPFEMA